MLTKLLCMPPGFIPRHVGRSANTKPSACHCQDIIFVRSLVFDPCPASSPIGLGWLQGIRGGKGVSCRLFQYAGASVQHPRQGSACLLASPRVGLYSTSREENPQHEPKRASLKSSGNSTLLPYVCVPPLSYRPSPL